MQQLLENIKAEILADVRFKSCLIYPNARGEFIAPAVFLEVSGYRPGNDPATEELALVANVEARVVVDSVADNAELVCQQLACEIANIAHLNSFGLNISPAVVMGVSRDVFKPEFDAFICWMTDWTHEFHIGDSVWNETGLPPHTINIQEYING